MSSKRDSGNRSCQFLGQFDDVQDHAVLCLGRRGAVRPADDGKVMFADAAERIGGGSGKPDLHHTFDVEGMSWKDGGVVHGVLGNGFRNV